MEEKIHFWIRNPDLDFDRRNATYMDAPIAQNEGNMALAEQQANLVH